MEKMDSHSHKDNKSFSLINGSFASQDAIHLIGSMVNTKIAYHENCILKTMDEEDIKHREKRIRELQNDWKQLRDDLLVATGPQALKLELKWENRFLEDASLV